MNKLVVLSGIPGSGKSYFSQTVKEIKGTHVYIVSSDQLRKEMMGSQRNLSKDNEMWKIFYELPKVYAYDSDALTILDATHIKSSYRLRVFNDMKNYYNEVYLVYFTLDKEKVFEQNKEREYPVPDYVLENFYQEFELPSDEEMKSFNRVYVIKNNEIDKVVNEII